MIRVRRRISTTFEQPASPATLAARNSVKANIFRIQTPVCSVVVVVMVGERAWREGEKAY